MRTSATWNTTLSRANLNRTCSNSSKVRSTTPLSVRITSSSFTPPPLDEQQRIVARIEALAGKVQEALRLQEGALTESVALLASTMDREYSKADSRWGSRPLKEVSQINPSRKSQPLLADDSPVTFVPMAAVDADTGTITNPEVRPYRQVKRGYTLFRAGDVLGQRSRLHAEREIRRR